MPKLKPKPMEVPLELTTVNMHPEVYNNFKMAALQPKMSFKKLVNRAAHLYAKDPDFRNKILSCTDLVPYGSL